MALEGKRALITGSSRGIGRSVALKLAEHGVAVAVHYHKDESAAGDTLAARPGSRRRLLALAGRRAAGMQGKRMRSAGSARGRHKRYDGSRTASSYALKVGKLAWISPIAVGFLPLA